MALSEAARVSEILGIAAATDQELISAIEIGLPLASLHRVTAIVSPRTPEAIIGKIVSGTTLKRRKAAEKSAYTVVQAYTGKLASLYARHPPSRRSSSEWPVIWIDWEGDLKPVELGGAEMDYLEENVSAFRLPGGKATAKEWREEVTRSHLSQGESEKVERLASIWTLAKDVMGDEELAREFLERKHPLLGDEAPIDVALGTDRGRQLVQEILLHVQYGSAA